MKPWQFSLAELFGIAVAVIALAFAAGHSLRTSTLRQPVEEQDVFAPTTSRLEVVPANPQP